MQLEEQEKEIKARLVHIKHKILVMSGKGDAGKISIFIRSGPLTPVRAILIRKINSLPDDVRKIAALAREIAPDRIQLNTAVRPPAEDFVTPLAKEQISALTRLFQPNAEIIAEFSTAGPESLRANEETIFAMLQRRSCTANQIADAFGMHLNEVLKYLDKLIRADQIRTEWIKNTVYYVAVA